MPASPSFLAVSSRLCRLFLSRLLPDGQYGAFFAPIARWSIRRFFRAYRPLVDTALFRAYRPLVDTALFSRLSPVGQYGAFSRLSPVGRYGAFFAPIARWAIRRSCYRGSENRRHAAIAISWSDQTGVFHIQGERDWAQIVHGGGNIFATTRQKTLRMRRRLASSSTA